MRNLIRLAVLDSIVRRRRDAAATRRDAAATAVLAPAPPSAPHAAADRPRLPDAALDDEIARLRATTRRDALVAAGLAALVAAVGGAMTLWGPCFGDPGELQTAAAVLGITHPPGYPGYVLIGRLFCLLPLAEPAAIISGLNLLAGAAAVALLYLIQRRLRVIPLAAVVTTLILVLHDRFWLSLTAPEVYIPSLLLLLFAVYAALRWAQGAAQTWVLAAASSAGLLVINRPSDALMMPALLLFVGLAAWRRVGRGPALRALTRRLLLAALVPIVICAGFLLLRDRPTTPYNYIEDFHQTFEPIGRGDGSALDRAQRLVWLLSAAQYQEMLVNSWPRLRVRLEYLRDEFGYLGLSRHDVWYRGPAGFYLGLGVVLLGLIRLAPRDAPAAAMLLLLALGNAVFYCFYRVYGAETHILPALAAVACLAGAGLTRLIGLLHHRRPALAALLAVIAAFVYLGSDDDWFQRDRDLDARAFLAAADPATLPRDAVILGIYDDVTPLQYSLRVRHPRPDVVVRAVAREHFPREMRKWTGRPLYYVREHATAAGYALQPERNLFRVVRTEATAE